MLPGYLDQGRQGRHSVDHPPYFRPQDGLFVDTAHGSSGMGPASAPVPQSRRGGNQYQAHVYDPYSDIHRPSRRLLTQHTISGYRPEPMVEDHPAPRRSSLGTLRPYSPRHPSPPSGHNPSHPPEDLYPRRLSAPRVPGQESSRDRVPIGSVSTPDHLHDPVPYRVRQSSLPHFMDYQYHDPQPHPRHIQTGQHYFYAREPAVHPLADYHTPRPTYPGTDHPESYFSDAQTHYPGHDSTHRHTPHPPQPYHHQHGPHYPSSHPQPPSREGYPVEQGESSTSKRSSQGLVRGNQPYRPPTPFVSEDIHMPDGSLSNSSRKVSLGSVHVPPLPPGASSQMSSMPSHLVQAMNLSGSSNSRGGMASSSSMGRPSSGPTFIISRHDGMLVNSSGLRTQFHAPLEPEVTARLDELFFKFLQRICSDCKRVLKRRWG